MPRVTRLVGEAQLSDHSYLVPKPVCLYLHNVLISREIHQETGGCEEGRSSCYFSVTLVYPGRMAFERLVDNYILY